MMARCRRSLSCFNAVNDLLRVASRHLPISRHDVGMVEREAGGLIRLHSPGVVPDLLAEVLRASEDLTDRPTLLPDATLVFA